MRTFLIALVLLLGGGVIASYLYVDQKVVARLSNRALKRQAAIYSDVLRIPTGYPLSKEAFIARLERRNYGKVEGLPQSPGEYAIDGTLITLRSREFLNREGSTTPQKLWQYDLNNGNVSSEKGAENALIIEPIMLAPFGRGEVRASSFKKLSSIPQDLQNAVLAIEDKRFRHHFGVDPVGIFRAMAENFKAMKFVQGGSTLTQQLAKNTLFTPKKTLGRKVQEMLAAVSLERHLSKDEILEMYLNEIYFGQEGAVSVHGAQEAAHTFFGKEVGELTLSECALLAGMIQAPSFYSPRKNLSRALERRDVVLAEMKEQGFISAEQYQEAKKQKIHINDTVQHKRYTPYLLAHIEHDLSQNFDLEALASSGVSVFTAIDPEMQECAERAVSIGSAKLEKQYPSLLRNKSKEGSKHIEQALVAIEPYSGAVKAWVGGRDFQENQFDHISQARRQIGSTIKPFLYLTAMDKNLNSYKVATALHILSDEPTGITLFNQQTWSPENFDHQFRGDVTVRYALEHSLNVPAVYVAQRVGIPALVHTAQLFRLSDQIPAVPALALGALDTTLLRMTSAFGALANGGLYSTPRPYLVAFDSDGTVLNSTDSSEERIADEGAAYVVTDILRGVVERGTATVIRKLGFTRPAAGKTGTSNDTRDAWFIGFTPNLVAGVWTGYDDNKKLGLTGGQASAPIWTEFMKCASSSLEPLDFVAPPSVVSISIDPRTRLQINPDCPPEAPTKEIFVQGTEPTEQTICEEVGVPLGGVYSEEPPLSTDEYDDRPLRLPEEDTPRDERPTPRRGGLWERIFGG